MSGRYSRQKGYRNEILVRDAIRKEGYTDCYRVPLSGAHSSNKGDLEFTVSDGHKLKCEVKSRKNGFNVIYKYLVDYDFADGAWGVCDGASGQMFSVSTSATAALSNKNFYMGAVKDKAEAKAVRKVLKLKEMLGECHLLAIKDDHKPPLYIVYL